MNQRGFTLIELMIVLVIIGIVYVIVSTGVSTGSASDISDISYGVNGLTEVRCIDGLKFIVGQSGSVQQMLGPNGGGIQCQ